MCIGIIWNNSFLVGGRARAEARIDPRPLRMSHSTAHGAQVAWPLDYMSRASDQVITWMCSVCLLAKQHTVFKWKDATSGFPVSYGSAETIDMWGEKTKHRLISYFPSNTSAKNYGNQIVYVKIIASQRWDVFETQCTVKQPVVLLQLQSFYRQSVFKKKSPAQFQFLDDRL